MRVGLRPTYFCKDKRVLWGYNYSNIPTLFESDDVACGELIRFEDNIYSICIVSPDDNFALAKRVNINNNPEEEINDDKLKCPVCGSDDYDLSELDNEGDADYECGNCGASLSYNSKLTRTFCVTVKEMPKIRNATTGYVGQQTNNMPKPVMSGKI